MTAGNHEVAYRQEDNKRVLISEKIEPLARETAISTTFSIRKSWEEFNNIDETAGKNLTGWQKDKLD